MKYFGYFPFQGKIPVSVDLLIMQPEEVTIIGPASFRRPHEMLLRPVALFADNLTNNFNTTLAEVCCD